MIDQMIPGLLSNASKGIAASGKINNYTNPADAQKYGSAKGEAIGGAVGTLLSPIVPFAPVVGQFLGGLIGGGSAKRKAEQRYGHLQGRKENTLNLYQQDTQSNFISDAQQDIHSQIKDNYRANVINQSLY